MSEREGEESENNNSAIECVKEAIFIHESVAPKEGSKVEEEVTFC